CWCVGGGDDYDDGVKMMMMAVAWRGVATASGGGGEWRRVR
ncbi:hypothetical protein Tco_0740644, partial [Tanacetum coccineum]